MKVQVSEHAIDKYIGLVKSKYGLTIKSRRQAAQSIADLFEQSEREELYGGLVKRIIDNNFEPADYYRYENWRIVLHKTTIVTIEDAYLKQSCVKVRQLIYKDRLYRKYKNRMRKKKEYYGGRRNRKATAGKCNS